MPDMLYEHRPPFSWATISGHCWVSVLHAILMQFLWRTSFLTTIVTFCFVRPFHTSALLAWLTAVATSDPHEYTRALLDVTSLDKAIVAFVSYFGALVSLRIIIPLILFLLRVLAFVWAHLLLGVVLSLVMLVLMAVLGEIADVAVQRAKYRIENYTWSIRNEYSSGRPVITIRSALYRAGDSLLVYKRRLAMNKRIARLLERQPYDELSPFAYSPISPTSQVRLLEIKRRTFLSLPTATLVVYNVEDSTGIPPYEVVSFTPTLKPDNTSYFPIVLNNQRHTIPSEMHALLTRLTYFFSPHLVWIDALCVNPADDDEQALEKETSEIMLQNARRVLVCLGESPLANFGVSVVNTLILSIWHYGLESAVDWFCGLCEYPRSALEDATLEGFLAMIDHPWFQDAERFRSVMNCGAEVTFLYGNEALMKAYLMQICAVFEAWDEERLRVALERTAGDRRLRWPPRAVPLFVEYTRAERQKEALQKIETLLKMERVFQNLGHVRGVIGGDGEGGEGGDAT
ncbi:hypothetical protein QBC34DRAFT_417566 [Podospora aff. communis PSN243]|uniref:Heterokaryon incompatibility domain-containing protein n=1 Tax=Podospora aff. communis PSN243 TaxID=3040156 RepID=A0AAV9G4P0_9PEZI|nr:hypothetical protein QBC34DRAFT_417566 [Podospora aff. communis PSN243]